MVIWSVCSTQVNPRVSGGGGLTTYHIISLRRLIPADAVESLGKDCKMSPFQVEDANPHSLSSSGLHHTIQLYTTAKRLENQLSINISYHTKISICKNL